jgi:hypothetical protein
VWRGNWRAASGGTEQVWAERAERGSKGREEKSRRRPVRSEATAWRWAWGVKRPRTWERLGASRMRKVRRRERAREIKGARDVRGRMEMNRGRVGGDLSASHTVRVVDEEQRGKQNGGNKTGS